MPKQKPNEQVQQIPLSEIRPFKNHPFKVTDDELMQQTIDSIMQVGVLNPAIIRPAPEGGYEMVAGHRRLHAADLAGLKTIPAIVRNLDDDEAVILMVDSNLQRETISPMERAQAYKMKLEALKHQGKRVDLTCDQVGHKLDSKKSIQKVAEDAGESKTQVQRYIDSGKIFVDNNDVTGWRESQRTLFWKDHASFIYQDYGIIDDETVSFNVSLKKFGNNQGQIKEVLEIVGLQGREKDKALVLSGGEKQRLGIARAILKNASVIFADEPTASLDNSNRQLVVSLLKDCANRGAAIILATHDERLVAECDTVVRLGT